MKNQIALPANQAKQSRISLWLNRENVLFSSIMEEKVSNRRFFLYPNLFRIHPLAGRHCLPLLVCLFHFTLQERRFAMTDSSQQPIFRVDKYQAYEEEAVLFEQYSILMYGSEKLCCTRPEMEQLSNLIQRALNDRKEAEHGNR